LDGYVRIRNRVGSCNYVQFLGQRKWLTFRSGRSDPCKLLPRQWFAHFWDYDGAIEESSSTQTQATPRPMPGSRSTCPAPDGRDSIPPAVR
jgi:hypothetical protein